MLIIPAIDISDGKCVRLTQGDFSSKKIYSEDPIMVAKKFEKEEAPMLHIVDLDGARTGTPHNRELVVRLRKSINIPVEVGGGIRNYETAQYYLEGGIERIIVGTKALTDQEFLKNLLRAWGPERIVVALDMLVEKLVSAGWQNISNRDFFRTARKLAYLGVTEVIVTDVERDGTLTSPNFEIVQEILSRGLRVIAAGGVTETKHLTKLQHMGAYGAIIGKALYEGRITVPIALQSVQEGQSNLAKRIIPCLDVKNGRVVKGVNFEDLRDAGDPVELGKKYAEEGADELVFLDIAASQEGRATMVDVVKKVAQEIFIPFTVGGGIQTIDQIRTLLNAGADKVSINTAAIKNPALISQAAAAFGSQCVVVAIDVKQKNGKYSVYINGGSELTELEAVTWAMRACQLGAGELLITSMDRDGTKSGFDCQLLQKISEAVSIPVIASGGAGSVEDMRDALTLGKADAVLAASLFHYGEMTIQDVKNNLKLYGIPVRTN